MPVTAAVIAAAVMVAGPSAQGQTAACPVTATDQAIDAQEQQLLTLINQYRASYGKKALAFHPDVTRAASWMSRDMATRNYFSHTDLNGRTPDQRLTWCGATYSNWAENIYA
ncbi:MAG: CAP domain-containing protein, partial [Actinobacteria bacterium]|nr:CAP domain-containing protein [Actinomycetota bacterium]